MSVATFPFRRAGSMPAVISLEPITAIDAPSAADPLRALAEMPMAGSPPRLSTHPGRFLAALHPPSRSALTSNPHSARCPAGPQLPATSCLGAFWTPVSRACLDPRYCRRPKTCTEPDSFAQADTNLGVADAFTERYGYARTGRAGRGTLGHQRRAGAGAISGVPRGYRDSP